MLKGNLGKKMGAKRFCGPDSNHRGTEIEMRQRTGFFTAKNAQIAKWIKARMPNELTARNLRRSKAGHGVKHFATKRELYADLGL
jgi:hypothetical protein